MAVYAAPSNRRRSAIALAVATLVAGLIIGVLIGRATAPSLDDKIADGRAGGRDLVTALQVLPLEYGQALSGSEGTSSIGDTVDRAAGQLGDALAGAPWLGPVQRIQATQAVQSVKTAATSRVAPAQFQRVVDSASAVIGSVFGLPVASAR